MGVAQEKSDGEEYSSSSTYVMHYSRAGRARIIRDVHDDDDMHLHRMQRAGAGSTLFSAIVPLNGSRDTN